MPHRLNLQSIMLLASAAARCGSDLNAVLEEMEIRVTSERTLLHQLPLPVLAELLHALERRATRGHFPFALAEVFNFEGQPAVRAFLASSQTLRDMNLVLDWASSLIHRSFRFERIEDGADASLLVHVDDPERRYADHPAVVELIAAVVAHICNLLAPGVRVFTSVQFAHEARAPQGSYDAWFGCAVAFGAPANQMIFDSRALDGELPGALPIAHAHAEEEIRVKLLGDGIAPPVGMLVEEALRQRLDLFDEGMTAVAGVLRLHPRTLQRRLHAEGYTYADLVAKVRHEMACEMLRGGELDIESIGIKLGYVERRSFTHAFQKWQGQTPSAYRKAMRRR